MNKNPNKFRKILFILTPILLLIFLGLLGLNFLWKYYLTAPGKEQTKKTFVINKGERVSEIALRLEKEGYIRNGLAFKVYLRLKGLAKNLQSGDFDLSKTMSISEVVTELSHGVKDKWITILEGWRNEEVAEVLEKELGISKEEFLAEAEQGYMFPDTYLVPKDVEISGVVEILRDNFNKKFNPDLEKQITPTKMTEEQVVVMASIVEREARNDEERAIVAGILIKRLKEGMLLEADATVQYALGFQPQENSWWKKSLEETDLKVDSPYNTRKYPGLPPKPISNPGLSSLKAVLFAKESSYWYYFHDNKGQIYYSKTLDEHNEKVARRLKI